VQVLHHLAPMKDPRALVGFGTSDDAAVYRLTPSLAVVETADFFPPVVDDPFQFGAIAAANAMSDIWAMGARPLFALNLVGFPQNLPLSMLSEILAGGRSKAAEAGIPILGGHSLQDPEPKYGMAVTGIVHPKKILRNVGAKPGDVLVLTKPLGSGIATTAIKRGGASKELTARVTELMAQLNKGAGQVFASGKFKVNALTDVTGFGLLGHLLEMMSGSKARAEISFAAVPVLEGIIELADKEIVPGGSKANLDYVRDKVHFAEGLSQVARWVLADAQTNGGLLASVPSKDTPKALRLLARAGVTASAIGEVKRGPAAIDVRS
jgi:selenide, water dikinase